MLSQISHSSKRLLKSKKYKNNLAGNGFDFLLQSMDRDKENCNTNALSIHYGQLSQSVNIDTQSTVPNKPLKKEKGPNIYIQNVRVLDCSDGSIDDVVQPKHPKKGPQKCYNHNVPMKTSQMLLKSMKQSQISTKMLSMSQINTQAQRHQRQKSIQMTSSYLAKAPQTEEEYIKMISKLESEREKLNSLVSKHQLANIKMFVKLNEEESQEIEKCKRQLTLLFGKYQELAKLIKKDKKKILELSKDKKQTLQKYKIMQRENEELKMYVKQLERASHRKSGSYFQDESSGPIKSLSINIHPGHSRQESSGYSYIEDSMYRRSELCLQSLRNSHCSLSQGPRSSLTDTSRPNKGGAVGINLNAFVESLKLENVKRFDDPHKMKKIVQECRRTILQIDNVINEQNNELQLSVKIIQEKTDENDDLRKKLKALEKKILLLESALNKQRDLRCEAQRTMIKTSELEQQRSMKLSRQSRRQVSQLSSGRQDRIKAYEGKQVTFLNYEPSLKYLDEYRIIATQAQTLQRCLKQQKLNK